MSAERPLLRLARPVRRRLPLVVVSTLGLCLATFATLGGPLVFARAIDGPLANHDGYGLLWLAGAYLSLWLLQVAGTGLARVGIEVAASASVAELREELFATLVDADLAVHDENPSGRLISRLQGDLQALQTLLSEVVLATPADVVLTIGMIGVLLYMTPVVALLVAAVIPAYGVALLVHRRIAPPLYAQERDARAELASFLAEHVRAMPILRAYDREAWAVGRADELGAKVQTAEIRTGWANAGFFNAVFFIRAVGFALVLWAGGYVVASGFATVGTLVLGLGYLRQMFSPLMRLSNQLGTIERARAAAVRVSELLDRPRLVCAPANPLPWPDGFDAIRYESVQFEYAAGVPVLRGIDLEIPRGSRIGLVGATGGGKSTLAALLLRFRDPTAGRVTIGGVDLADMDPATIRAKVAYVPQDIQLFSGTVLDNLGCDAATAARACATLDVEVDLGAEVDKDGDGLSRGERQLVTFVRALVRDPQILVLDEATSAFDPATERRVDRALQRLLEGRTVLVVAHRLSTIRDCDRIVVVAGGRLVEQGSHEELLAADGAYAKLVAISEAA